MTSDMPDEVRAAALAALHVTTPADLLATLSDDDRPPADGADLSHRLVFTAQEWQVTLDVAWTGERYAGVVRLQPHEPFSVRVFTADPGPQPVEPGLRTVAEDGSVDVGGIPAGPCKLLVTVQGVTIETEWCTLPRP
jgi:hypothetical protein